MSQQVLHLDFVSLSPEGQRDREQLIVAASKLAALPRVLSIGAIDATPESQADFDLVFYFLLPEFAALEPFGTDGRYAGFLQGEVAPRLKAFAGADVRLEADLDVDGAHAACLALMAPDETYDWEVREALAAWYEAAGAAHAAGLAVGEKQLYRGVGLAFAAEPIAAVKPDASRFHSTLIAGTARSLS